MRTFYPRSVWHPTTYHHWALVVLALGTAGCARERPAPADRERVGDGPILRDAWSRPATAGADGALYFTLANPGRDTLVAVGAQSDVAGATSLHESMQMGQGAGAMMRMTPLARVVVPPRDSVVFAPLGKHAMLEGLRRPLAVGDSVPFALAVTRGGLPDTLRTIAEVRAF